MNEEAEASLDGVDIILFMADLTSEPTEDDARLAELLRHLRRGPPIVLAGNKIDLMEPGIAQSRLEAYHSMLPETTDQIMISASGGRGLDRLMEVLAALCPVRPPEYDGEQITDLYEREIAADLIREAALHALRDEVPHGLAVRLEEYKERENGLDYIRATLLVERELAESHRDRARRQDDEADRNGGAPADRGHERPESLPRDASQGGEGLAEPRERARAAWL